ncbi:MAG TPA: hypothetical protein VGN26_15095 [Armatimonadota bacterium]|jgi:hypothetical protein
MVALDTLRQHWALAMLALGVLLTWALYRSHYGAPESRVPEGHHTFAGGLVEGEGPVPGVLVLFLGGMAVFALGYVAWASVVVGAY